MSALTFNTVESMSTAPLVVLSMHTVRYVQLCCISFAPTIYKYKAKCHNNNEEIGAWRLRASRLLANEHGITNWYGFRSVKYYISMQLWE